MEEKTMKVYKSDNSYIISDIDTLREQIGHNKKLIDRMDCDLLVLQSNLTRARQDITQLKLENTRLKCILVWFGLITVLEVIALIYILFL